MARTLPGPGAARLEPPSPPPPRAGGLRLVDLIVAIFVLGVLAALLVPAIGRPA